MSDFFLSENFPFLEVTFSIYLNRRVFVFFFFFFFIFFFFFFFFFQTGQCPALSSFRIGKMVF